MEEQVQLEWNAVYAIVWWIETVENGVWTAKTIVSWTDGVQTQSECIEWCADDVFDKYGDNHKTQKKNEKKLRQFDGISEISEESPL